MTYVRGPLRKGLQALIGSVDYQDDSLSEVLDDLREKSGANIVANWQSLSSAGIDKNTPVSLKLKNVSAGRILKAVAQNLSNSWSPVSYVEHGGIVIIATAKDLARIIDTRVYDIMHLLMETKDLRGGARYDSNRTSRRNSSGSRYDRDSSAGTDRTQKIVDIVRSSASEDSWRENGGPGGVAVFGTRLVVTQTAGNHAKIAMALTQLGW